jgi:FlaA1/EpsC-like NDP-sugar epimerase
LRGEAARRSERAERDTTTPAARSAAFTAAPSVSPVSLVASAARAVLRSSAVTRCTHSPALRYACVFGLDGVAAVLGLYAAMNLRLAGDVPPHFEAATRVALPVLVAIRLAIVFIARLHRWSFRMSGLPEAARLGFAMLLASFVFAVACPNLPRSVYALEFFLTTTFMAASRFAPRIVEGWYSDWHKRGSATALRTIIVGAGSTGDLLARDLQRPDGSTYYVVGFVDDDPAKRGMYVAGKPVLGSVDDLPQVIERNRASTVLLAVPSMPAKDIRSILALCASCKASFKTIPGSYVRLDRRISAAMLHDLSPDDLLPRDPISFDQREIRNLVEGHDTLVTGAGGTIGGEICRQLAQHGASSIVMVDMNENELYLRARAIQQEHPSVRVFTEVADIRDYVRLRALGEEYEPELVFHAAAHKHVPLMETAPEEAVKNNVFGTLNVALMAHDVGARQLVVISTDKAVNPTSVMGATKRIAELVVRDLARRSGTKMTAVRFGNVLGSAGSVVPLFKQQIERGGPVTVTHPECTRYFMTVSEAVGLVLLAGLGNYGDLCVLDMGEQIRIAEIASNLITMSGRVPDVDIPIVYTGLRPGEKLYEELLTEEEEETAQVRNRINIAKSPPPPPDLAVRLHTLQELAQAGAREELLDAVQDLVPTYRRTPGQPMKAVKTPAPVAKLTLTPMPSASAARVAASTVAASSSAEPKRRVPGSSWLHTLTFR